MPLVSVCCNTYNHEKYVGDAIEGFLMQKTVFAIEILIHDDASTDNTANIIREYAQKCPSLIFPILQKENQYSKGIKALRTFIYPLARGEYIARCEGDDYWTDPYKLQKQVGFLEQNKEYVVSYHNVDIVDKDNNLILRNDGPKVDFSSIELMKGPILPMSSLCFRNEIVGFPVEGYSMAGGHRLLISRLGQLGKGKWMGDKITSGVYRKHPQGMWSGMSDIEKFFLHINNSFWLYQYYKRIGCKEVENYFYNEFIKKISASYYFRHPRKALRNLIFQKT